MRLIDERATGRACARVSMNRLRIGNLLANFVRRAADVVVARGLCPSVRSLHRGDSSDFPSEGEVAPGRRLYGRASESSSREQGDALEDAFPADLHSRVGLRDTENRRQERIICTRICMKKEFAPKCRCCALVVELDEEERECVSRKDRARGGRVHPCFSAESAENSLTRASRFDANVTNLGFSFPLGACQ